MHTDTASVGISRKSPENGLCWTRQQTDTIFEMAHWSLVSQQLSSANLIPYEDKDHVITPIDILFIWGG